MHASTNKHQFPHVRRICRAQASDPGLLVPVVITPNPLAARLAAHAPPAAARGSAEAPYGANGSCWRHRSARVPWCRSLSVAERPFGAAPASTVSMSRPGCGRGLRRRVGHHGATASF